jgi:hypothetical protein
MYITTKYLPPANVRGSRIQFALVDNGKSECLKTFSYYQDAPVGFNPPFKRTKYVTTLLKEELTMIYNLEQYLKYLREKRGIEWKADNLSMTRLSGYNYIFTFKMHTIELGE